MMNDGVNPCIGENKLCTEIDTRNLLILNLYSLVQQLCSYFHFRYQLLGVQKTYLCSKTPVTVRRRTRVLVKERIEHLPHFRYFCLFS